MNQILIYKKTEKIKNSATEIKTSVIIIPFPASIWTSYMSHVRIKHPSEFICGFCGYSFISKLGLAMHKTMMHKEIQVCIPFFVT